MLEQFTEEYRQIMLDAEQRARQFWYREILPEDIFLQVSKISQWPIADIFVTYGINESVLIDLFSRPPFLPSDGVRSGTYIGISERMRTVIILSLRIASHARKRQAGIEDFILALADLASESWLPRLLDFIGIDPSDFFSKVATVNRSQPGIDGQNTGGIFGPIDEIMNMIEDHFGGTEEGSGQKEAPFSNNPPQEKRDSTTPALDFFGIDLTAEAQQKKIDPVIGRDTEIERLISILNRKTKNNPCLVGDPWVGKTAVVEGLARRIAEGAVPFAMQNKRLIALDLSAMVAGTKYRGEFENRIKMVIDEASKLENEIILFIDEIHTIIGAGASEWAIDAANILKPAMARGKISLIGATTIDEYQKYIEKDSALERRFQKIDVDEPTKAVAVEIMMWLRSSFEEFHNLIIDEGAIVEAVDLSSRYITDRFLPDKAIDLLDEACSAKSMTYNADTSEVIEIREQIEVLQKDMSNLLMTEQYQKALMKRKAIDALQLEIEEKKKKKSIPLKDRLRITGSDIQKVIHQITGVPLKNLQKEDITRLRWLGKTLSKRILWQNDAIESIVSSLKRSHTGISSQARPIGSFLFLWPTGVGKTELVKVLAEEFYADPKALIKIDMSEFQDKASASKLIGTTAGYVGYDEGGMLTERVRRKPYSIVLFDEIEKANFDIYNLLLQILEDGVVTDGKGREINFKNTIIIMTSNIGSEEFNEKAAQIGFSLSESEEKRIVADYDDISDRVLAKLPDFFTPEFLNRIDKMIVFRPLDKKVLSNIITLQMEELKKRLVQIGVSIDYDKKLINSILKETYNPEYGARPVRRFIQDKIEDRIADALIDSPRKRNVTISADKNGITFTWK